GTDRGGTAPPGDAPADPAVGRRGRVDTRPLLRGEGAAGGRADQPGPRPPARPPVLPAGRHHAGDPAEQRGGTGGRGDGRRHQAPAEPLGHRLCGGHGRLDPRVLPLVPHRPAVRGHGLGVRPGLTTATAVLAAPIRRSLPLTEGNQPLTRSDSPVLVPPVPDTRPGSGGRRTLSCHPCRTTGSGTAHG